MAETIIRAEGLSKRYRLGAGSGYKTFRETLAGLFRPRPEPETVWALRDVSFEVRRGEVLGIIGRNGAGKSTLLKILSRITEPTSGCAELRGRVGSLLEVGTGFHPELSGRENVYLYGAILGMTRAEIRRKFDEIVSFAEVERFMDTPVKRYSSGMYMRLAFSVAAHLEPEILLVDEVLAVGDAIFQRKCIKKMREAAGGGKTVLFVSHNMPAVAGFCGRALLIEGGRLAFSGPASDAVAKYLSSGGGGESANLRERRDRSGSGAARLTGFRLLDGRGRDLKSARNGDNVQLAFDFECAAGGVPASLDFQLVVRRQTGEPVFQFGTRFTGQRFDKVPREGQIRCRIKRLPLVPENYLVDAYLVAEASPADYVSSAAVLPVVDGDFYGSGYQVFEKESGFLVDGDMVLTAKE